MRTEICPRNGPHAAHKIPVIYRWKCNGVPRVFLGDKISECGQRFLHLPHWVNSDLTLECEGNDI